MKTIILLVLAITYILGIYLTFGVNRIFKEIFPNFPGFKTALILSFIPVVGICVAFSLIIMGPLICIILLLIDNLGDFKKED